MTPSEKALIFQAFPPAGWYCDAMKLCQGQVWKQGGQYIRIVRLERLEESHHLTQVAAQLPMGDASTVLVDDTDHYVIAVQINSCD